MLDKSSIHLMVPSVPGLELRSATSGDLELLRHWKNAQREFFFYQREISEIEQIQWFNDFTLRNNDIMLMNVLNKKAFGCMGIRWKSDHWDVYNVILGLPEYGKRGLMGRAFTRLLDFAITLKVAPITLEVLKHNPAITWYQRQGFCITSEHETHFDMSYHTKYDSGAII